MTTPPNSLSRPFRATQYVFQPSTTGSVRANRLRVPLRYSGELPASVLDYAAAVRGEPLFVVFNLPAADGGKKPERSAEAVGRIEGATLKVTKGAARPTVTLSLVFESAEVVEIAKVLDLAVEAARAEVLELDVDLRLVQPGLPGLETGPLDPDLRKEEKRKSAGETPPTPPSRKVRRPRG